MPEPRKPLQTAAYVVVLVAATWWLLGQWANVLRPLLLAIFLAYILLPWHSRLRRAGLPAPLVILGLAGMVTVVLWSILQIAYSNTRELRDELPVLQARFHEITQPLLQKLHHRAPWLPLPQFDGDNPLSAELSAFGSWAVSASAGGLLEVLVAALYLLFLLLGAERLPTRVRQAYPGPAGDRILNVAGNINAAIISYLRAKALSSLMLALGTGLVLLAFGVKFVAIWMLLVFLCNFVPYLGSVIGYVLPTAYAALQLPPWGEPIAVAVLLLAVQVASATLIEPMFIGRAVGLSPILMLVALAIWGTVWGLPGMILAVPLTVVLKLVLQNIDSMKPLAKLAEE